ncbi:AEC family transporter [Brevibacillus dissolubilis]|uniref:AEC family transporter n=1 Tax=Brevibacillus dissolubilis TaxID=1844116 RepID=UPI001116F39C|nr:AEC family transporter [Brevibacillus dissolubilis]
MNVFTLIILDVILPIFTLIGVGAFLHRKFNLDMGTLSKLNTHLLLPVVSFLSIYESKMAGETLFHIIGFLLLQSVCMIILSVGIAKVAHMDRSLSAAFQNSVVLFNSANYGLPISQLVFQHNPFGASIQIVIIIFQTMLTNTWGLKNSISASISGLGAVKEFMKNPVFCALLLGFIFHALSIQIPTFIMTPMENLSTSFLAIALVTLGAQSAHLNIKQVSRPLVLSLAGRLVLSPLVALAVIFALGLDGVTAQALFIASSFPSSRNSALLALQYGNHPEYAAQTVLVSTILSSVTVALVVYVSKILFPY